MKAIQDGPARPENPAQMPDKEIIAKISEISSKSRIIHEAAGRPTWNRLGHNAFSI